jgi:regulator of RNase E activity RraA
MADLSNGPLTPERLAFLQSLDSPTIANAIEAFKVRDREDGYIGGAIRCQFPDLGTMVGYALTVTMSHRHGPIWEREGWWRMWEALEKAPNPAVVVVKDVSGAPTRCAYWGEVMATFAQRLGAVGIVTDGALRDVKEAHALGLHYFMPYPVVSHGNVGIVDVGTDVWLDGQLVRTGDILHGEANGIVVVPTEVLDGLPDAVQEVQVRERKLMDFVKSDQFTLEAARSGTGY